ncbi:MULTISPECIES: stage II sporulation protein M [unclassified Moraxella]|uniref:stage II sporulation protein M n=1 Tax=unclassified Moraxella TaxID=2685852 RepID=UPI003AF5FE74
MNTTVLKNTNTHAKSDTKPQWQHQSHAVVAVKQASFVNRYQSVWQQFDQLCEALGVEISTQVTQVNHANQPHQHIQLKTQAKKSAKSTQQAYPMIRLYRQICQHYALAKQRHYSPQLVAQLHQRVMVGHQLIYQTQSSYIDKFLDFVFYIFPARLRQHQRLFWLAFALFYVPLILMLIGCYLNQELIYSVMSPDQVAEMEFMYNPANMNIGRGSDRQADTDMMMFGVYIYNNISIDFQMYASGLFAGIGTIISTLYNGVVIGAVAGHLTQLGYSDTFWSFVCGHSSFELTACVIASTAGLRLAQALIAPAPYSRKDAFRVAGKQSIQILLGAGLMTFLAAFIEAFWSSSQMIPSEVKYAVALVLWTLVGYYLTMAGRGHPIAEAMTLAEVDSLANTQPNTKTTTKNKTQQTAQPNHLNAEPKEQG